MRDYIHETSDPRHFRSSPAICGPYRSLTGCPLGPAPMRVQSRDRKVRERWVAIEQFISTQALTLTDAIWGVACGVSSVRCRGSDRIAVCDRRGRRLLADVDS